MPYKLPVRKFVDYTTDSSVFDLDEYLSRAVPDPILLQSTEGRKFLTANNPLLFALIYYPAKLKLGDKITFADFHLEVSKWAALEWTREVDIEVDPAGPVDAFICPRGMGKSTWVIDILVMWAACHGHQKFIALFADTPTQAQFHLANFRESAKTNELLREDYPRVCRDGTDLSGKFLAEIKETDRQDFYRATSGFAFAAKGIETGTLGLKVGDDRPSLIICDDIIKDSGSLKVIQQRLDTFIKKILPLRKAGGRVVITGTSFTPGDMIHQLKKAAQFPDQAAKWIKGIKATPHYYPPFITNPDGTTRSCWSARWSKEWLEQSQKNDPSFPAAFLNEPIPEDGSYWKKSDFKYGSLDSPGNARILSIDPALTAGRKSDYTALACVKYSASQDMFEVMNVQQVKLQGEDLREKIIALVELFEISEIMIETNSVGSSWEARGGVLHDIPGVRIKQIRYGAGESKEKRAEWALLDYQNGKVLHKLDSFYDFETQLMAFPSVAHDDMVDSVTTVIYQVRKAQRAAKANAGPVVASTSYVRGR